MSLPGLTGSIAAGAAGGGGASIPASIIAGDSLAHWWKMNEGDTSIATDYGLSASSTDMSLTGAANAAGDGPSEIGSPNVIGFNGCLLYTSPSPRDA